MALTDKKKQEIKKHAQSYVREHVKCNHPESRYMVLRNTCDSIDTAVDIAMKRITRPDVMEEDVNEQDEELRKAIKNEIIKLNCI